MALDFASIGLRIKHSRTKKGMTQETLSELLGVSRNQITYMETGERGISLELLVSVSNVLDVPISDLLADNLSSADKSATSELQYLLLDCTSQEEKSITKAAKALKAILSEHGV